MVPNHLKFQGIFPVAAAPFMSDGAVDLDGLRCLVEFEIKAGADGFVLFGFATEFYKLSESEKLQMLQTVVEQARGRLPVIASVTEQTTDLAVKRAREMEANGAAGLMLLPPFLIPAGKDAFVKHIRTVAQAVRVPIIVQYSPIETGVAIDPATFGELMADFENLQYLKIESKPPGPMISAVLQQSKSPLGVMVGYAGLQMIDALDRGAVGVMPGSSFTDVYCRIYRLYRSGHRQQAMALHNKLVPFLNVIFQSIEMIIYWEKVILKRRGVISSDYCRFPCFEPDPVGRAYFEDYYDRFSQEFLF